MPADQDLFPSKVNLLVADGCTEFPIEAKKLPAGWISVALDIQAILSSNKQMFSPPETVYVLSTCFSRVKKIYHYPIKLMAGETETPLRHNKPQWATEDWSRAGNLVTLKPGPASRQVMIKSEDQSLAGMVFHWSKTSRSWDFTIVIGDSDNVIPHESLDLFPQPVCFVAPASAKDKVLEEIAPAKKSRKRRKKKKTGEETEKTEPVRAISTASDELPSDDEQPPLEDNIDDDELEEKRKLEDEKKRREDEEKRREVEKLRKEEEKKKKEEDRLKKEEEKKKKEAEKKRKEEERKRKVEEEKRKKEEEKKKEAEIKEEEKRKEEERKRKEEEEKARQEELKAKKAEELRREEEKKKEENRKKLQQVEAPSLKTSKKKQTNTTEKRVTIGTPKSPSPPAASETRYPSPTPRIPEASLRAEASDWRNKQRQNERSRSNGWIRQMPAANTRAKPISNEAVTVPSSRPAFNTLTAMHTLGEAGLSVAGVCSSTRLSFFLDISDRDLDKASSQVTRVLIRQILNSPSAVQQLPPTLAEIGVAVHGVLSNTRVTCFQHVSFEDLCASSSCVAATKVFQILNRPIPK